VKAAVVTGAASGIGAATVDRLRSEGYRMWAFDLDREALDRRAASDDGVTPVIGDVSSPEDVSQAFEAVTREASSLDVLVCSAGICRAAPFDSISVELFELTWRVNVLGTYLCLQAALPLLRQATAPARVVNVASIGAKQPSPYLAAYAATKAAVVSLTRSAAAALAPEILVNCVCPGAIETAMWDSLGDDLKAIGAQRSTTATERGASVPLKRAGSAEEVAELIASLCGPAGTYITGEDINCSGGAVMH
jgi:NAD(P)-dependent dehydrogenase (short-subunit alcohol dehydrogenase family)